MAGFVHLLLPYLTKVGLYAGLPLGALVAIWLVVRYRSQLASGARTVLVIARNTVAEALSRIVLQVILIFALLFLIIGFFFTYMAPAEEEKLLKDLGITVITVFGLVLAIFMGVSLIQPEVERRTLYAVLAKPVRRFEFMLGKYLGAMVVLALAVVIMGVVFVAGLYLRQQTWSPQLLTAVVGIYLALMIMTALVMMISTFASGLIAVIFGFVFWAIGYGQSSIQQLAEHAENKTSQVLLGVIHAVLPNFTYLDLRQAVVAELPLSPALLGKMALYGLGYTVVVIAIAGILFNEREM